MAFYNSKLCGLASKIIKSRLGKSTALSFVFDPRRASREGNKFWLCTPTFWVLGCLLFRTLRKLEVWQSKTKPVYQELASLYWHDCIAWNRSKLLIVAYLFMTLMHCLPFFWHASWSPGSSCLINSCISFYFYRSGLWLPFTLRTTCEKMLKSHAVIGAYKKICSLSLNSMLCLFSRTVMVFSGLVTEFFFLSSFFEHRSLVMVTLVKHTSKSEIETSHQTSRRKTMIMLNKPCCHMLK